MRASPPDRSVENRHRALSSRTRLRLLELLRDADTDGGSERAMRHAREPGRDRDLDTDRGLNTGGDLHTDRDLHTDQHLHTDLDRDAALDLELHRQQRTDPAGRRDAHALARELGLHVNTVRAHLAILERNGLVLSEPEDRRVRGRPRILYRAAATSEPVTDDGYRFLATVLAGTLESDAAEPGRLAQEAGERWGRHLVEAPEPGHRSGSTDAVGRAVALLDDLGFAPHVDEDDPDNIELHRCPYRELAIDHADVVCGIHLGILRGALAGSGASTDDITLTPFVSETMCLARLNTA